jgi:hypothetical protein
MKPFANILFPAGEQLTKAATPLTFQAAFPAFGRIRRAAASTILHHPSPKKKS